MILLSVYLIRKDEPKEAKDTNKENQKVETTENETPVDVEIEEKEDISKEEVEVSKIESEEETSEDDK